MSEPEEEIGYLIKTLKASAERCRESFKRPTPESVSDAMMSTSDRLRRAKRSLRRLLSAFQGDASDSLDMALGDDPSEAIATAVKDVIDAKAAYDLAMEEYNSYPHGNTAYDRAAWAEVLAATTAITEWSLKDFHGLDEVDSRDVVEGFPGIETLGRIDAVLGGIRKSCIDACIADGGHSRALRAAKVALAWAGSALREEGET